MKKIFSMMPLILAAIVFFNLTTAQATLPNSAFALGGVSPGMSRSDAVGILGDPTWSDGDELKYADGLSVEIKHELVKEIQAKRGASVATPAGIKVGQQEATLNEIYGRADKVHVEDGGYEVDYTYYSHDGNLKMKFKVKNSVITEIECELR